MVNDGQAIRLDQIEEDARIRLSRYCWYPYLYLNSGMPENPYLREGPEYLAAFNALVAIDLMLNMSSHQHTPYDWGRLQDNLEYQASRSFETTENYAFAYKVIHGIKFLLQRPALENLL